MNIIVSSSRGRAVEPYFAGAYKSNIPYIYKTVPGGKFNTLTRIALEHITKSPNLNKPVHVYYLAGLPDLTTKLRNRKDMYEEVVFNEEPQAAIDRMSSLIIQTHETITSLGAKAIFCPIIPINLTLWNTERQKQNKTSHLLYSPQYPIMQINLHHSITNINQLMVMINKENNLTTPFIDNKIITSLPAKPPHYKPRYKFSYSQFRDGCHPSHEIAEQWAQKILQAIHENQVKQSIVVPSKSKARQSSPTTQTETPTSYYSSEDEEDKSPKRSWKLEKNHNQC